MHTLTSQQIAFKSAASKFPSGVVVAITNYDDTWHGMTISSFTTISLDPLLVMIAISNRSKMHDLLKQQDSCKFSISILADDQSNVSSHFAGQKREEISNDLENNVIHLNDHTVIKNCLSYFLCELDESINKGDHTLYFGRVIDSQTTPTDTNPLVYYSRSYHSLTQKI